ncbi:MAG: hypothetical protein JXB05_10905 [Myxococcaceae bacterium]|nr:hypothetical protein [Myxococcaceae bacterium]
MKNSLIQAMAAVVALVFSAPALADPSVIVETPQQQGPGGLYVNWGYYSDALYPGWDRLQYGFGEAQNGFESADWSARRIELKIRFDASPGALPPTSVEVYWENLTDGTSEYFTIPVAYSLNPDGQEHYWTAFSVYRLDYAMIEWRVGFGGFLDPSMEFEYFVDGDRRDPYP